MQNLEKRLFALEGEPRSYRAVVEMPDDVLEAMLSPLCGGRVPTDEDLRAIAGGTQPANNRQTLATQDRR